jgi:hypothetical protein
MFDPCETWGELLCLSTLAYLGPCRGASSQLRWRDSDLERETIRFKEKGGPHALRASFAVQFRETHPASWRPSSG